MASRQRSGAYKPRAYKSSYKPRAYKSARKGRDEAKVARTVLVGLLVVAVAIFAVTAVLNKKKTSGGNAAQTQRSARRLAPHRPAAGLRWLATLLGEPPPARNTATYTTGVWHIRPPRRPGKQADLRRSGLGDPVEDHAGRDAARRVVQMARQRAGDRR